MKRLLAGLFFWCAFASQAASLVNGSNFTANGSGFGTRTVVRDVFDKATGASVSALWNDAVAYSYSSGFHSVPMPHAFATKYAVAQVTNANVGNAWLSHNISGLTGTKKIYVAAYRRIDPNWTYGTSCDAVPDPDQDNNFKFLTVSAGGSYFANPYWYHTGHPQKCALTANHGENFFSSGSLGTLSNFGTDTGGAGAQSEDMWYSWTKVEYAILLHASAGSVKFSINNTVKFDLASLNTDDAAGTSRAVSIGDYSRQRDGAGHYTYLADIVQVAGPDAWKRLVLANNATYVNATITEFQPIVSWSDTAIQFTVNQGALPLGPAFLFLFDETNTIIASAPVTLTGATTNYMPFRF